MGVTSNRSVRLQFTGDVVWSQDFSAIASTTANAQSQVSSLTIGFNAFTIPTGQATVPSAVTIVPSTTNTIGMTLKGVTGDTGIPLSPNSPSCVALATTATTFGITAASTISSGVRLIYS